MTIKDDLHHHVVAEFDEERPAQTAGATVTETSSRPIMCRHYVRVRVAFDGSLPDCLNELRDPEQFLGDPTLRGGQLTAEDPTHPDSPAMEWSTP